MKETKPLRKKSPSAERKADPGKKSADKGKKSVEKNKKPAHNKKDDKKGDGPLAGHIIMMTGEFEPYSK